MRTTKTRIAGIAGSAAIVGTAFFAAAAPSVLAAKNIDADPKYNMCTDINEDYNSAVFTAESAGAKDGITLTIDGFAKQSDPHALSLTSDPNMILAYFVHYGGEGHNVLVTFDAPGVQSDSLSELDKQEIDDVTVCWLAPEATPSPSPTPTGTGGQLPDEGTPPPTSTVSDSNQDNGAWRLALVGIGGLLATMAVVAPRRLGKKS